MWNETITYNESDVEQKIIYPLLTESYPSGRAGSNFSY